MFNKGNRRQATEGLVEFPLWGQAWPNVEVAGESHHTADIEALFPKPLPDDGTEGAFTAHLVPEPTNRYDSNAVQVRIAGNLVGYLARAEAGRYQPALLSLRDNDLVGTVDARVWARPEIDFSYDRAGNLTARRTGAIHARVTLSLAEPHLVLPLNVAPTGVELPVGRALKLVTGASTAEACGPWLQPEGQGWVHMTLHRIEETLTRSTREIVEGRIDGVPAGRLTPAMSQNFLPLIDQLDERGFVCIARAIVKGNRVKAEVTLHAAKASEIAAAWLDTHVYSVPVRSAAPPVTTTVDPVAEAPTTVLVAQPAGWYDDPEGMAPLRYWDGHAWTTRIRMS